MSSHRNPSQNGKSKGRIYWFIESKGEVDNGGLGRTWCDQTLKTTGRWDSAPGFPICLLCLPLLMSRLTFFLRTRWGKQVLGTGKSLPEAVSSPKSKKILSKEYIGHFRSRIQPRTSPLWAGSLGTVVDPAGVKTYLWANQLRPGEGTP